MDKSIIKSFAVESRRKLIKDIINKLGLLGIKETGIHSPLPHSNREIQFFEIGAQEPYSITGKEIIQRDSLVDELKKRAEELDYKTAYNELVEEVAYTWFNRLIALRFMEVNDYLPSRVRVLSSESPGKIEPDIVTNPFDVDLNYTDEDQKRIIQLKNENKLDELFQFLFIKQCNKLNEILAHLFEKTDDYMELLITVSFIDPDGVVYRLVKDIPEEYFDVNKSGQIEIIGWLYQFYNTEPKDFVFSRPKGQKIQKQDIPAATQLFTPHWIVRYMVENSLGRLWIEGHPNDELKSSWKYYLDEAEQEPDVEKELEKIREEYQKIQPEEIKLIDPSMGSGHILVYAFDVLMQIYESQGYTQREAAISILENNIYGLDIDDRAYQLTYFALMMKARAYNRRIFSSDVKLNIYSIQESNRINRDHLKYFGTSFTDKNEWKEIYDQIVYILDVFHDAKEFGSIIKFTIRLDIPKIRIFLQHFDVEGQVSFETIGIDETKNKIFNLVEIAAIINDRYDVVVTNPPYMSSSGMSKTLSNYVRKYYSDSSNDLFAVFIEKCTEMTKKKKYTALITQQSWMFLTSFKKLRKKLLENDFVNMLHLGARAFEEISGEVVQTTSFIIRKTNTNKYIASYHRLVSYGSQDEKEQAFLSNNHLYLSMKNNFYKIPESPIAYWVSKSFVDNFDGSIYIEQISDFTGSQNITGDNKKYLRYFWEVDQNNIINKNWIFYAKGGEYRRYYGNLQLVVDWTDDARLFYKTNKTSNLLNRKYWFKEGITYSAVTTKGTGFRYLPPNCVFDKGGPSIIMHKHLYYVLALLNTKVAQYYFNVFNPTINLQVKDIKVFPIKISNSIGEIIENLSSENVQLTKIDWDSFETSWEFTKHPMFTHKGQNGRIETAYENWKQFTHQQFYQIKENEEALNRIFIEVYGLGNELTPDVDEKDVTITKIVDEKTDEDKKNRYILDRSEAIKTFVSYAVGCMFGRYSLDVDGLAYAGGEWDDRKYKTYIPTKDNIILISEDDYFKDDIVDRFVEFVKVTFGEKHLDENLQFIADALRTRGTTARDKIRNYFLRDFYSDHCKTYQKRPIYWLFDSGKQNGFKALIYMHRYDENTIGNLRIDYLHIVQQVYEYEINQLDDTILHSDNPREITQAQKQKEKLQKKLKECKDFDEKIAHLAVLRISIELDDGVNVNYDSVQTDQSGKHLKVLANI